MKACILCGITALIGGFLGKLTYEIISRPDGELYLDYEGGVYAALNKEPNEYKPGSRLIFVYKG